MARWMARYGVLLLRVALGVVFVWFGVLKYFPGLSPAQTLAAKTVETPTFGTIGVGSAMALLATLEVAIGIGLISGLFTRLTLLLLALQMVGALPCAPTLEGQYIAKNLVLVSAGIVIGATVLRAGVSRTPEVRQEEKTLPA